MPSPRRSICPEQTAPAGVSQLRRRPRGRPTSLRRAGGLGQRHDRQQSCAHARYRGAGSGEQPRPALCAGGRQAAVTAGPDRRGAARVRPLAADAIAVTPPATKSKHRFILIVILFSCLYAGHRWRHRTPEDQHAEVNMVLNAFDLTGKVAIVTGCDTGRDRE